MYYLLSQKKNAQEVQAKNQVYEKYWLLSRTPLYMNTAYKKYFKNYSLYSFK